MDGSKQSPFSPDAAETASELVFDGERYIPGGIENEIDLEHHHRYLAAAEMVRGLRVLDMASGSGYGSATLAKSAAEVVGLDIDPDSVSHARAHYAAPNLTFVTGDCANPPFEAGSFDAIVSFETIEHIHEQEKFLDACKRLLKPDGMLIISTPDKARYNAQLAEPNPYHVREMSERQFRRMLRTRFSKVKVSGQRVLFGSLIVPNGSVPKLGALNRRKGELEKGDAYGSSIYMIAVCSEVAKPAFPAGVYEGALPQNTVSSLVGGIRERDENVLKLRAELAEARAGAPAAAPGARATAPGIDPAVLAEFKGADKDLVRELAAHTSILASMRARYEWAGEELARAQQDRARLDAEVAGLQSQLADQQAATEAALSRLKQSEAARASLSAQLNDSHSAYGKVDADLRVQADALASVVRELNLYKKKVAEGEAEREGLIRDNNRIKEDFRFDQERFETMVARAAKAEAWLEAERRRVATLETRMAEMESKLVTQRQYLADAELAMAARLAEVASMARPAVAEAAEEALKAEAPTVAAAPVADAPAAETPKIEAPKTEVPKIEAPKIETQIVAPVKPEATEAPPPVVRPAKPQPMPKVKGAGNPIMAAPLDLLTFAKRSRNPRKILRMAMDAYLLRKTGAVDPKDYAARYPDIGAKSVDPVRHYLMHGANEGRDPGPDFSTSGYLASNPDVRTSGVNPLVHYVRFGRHEGRTFGRAPARAYVPEAAPPAAPAAAPAPARKSAAKPSAFKPSPPPQGDVVDRYAVRPDDVIHAEIARGESFLGQFNLLDPARADHDGAVAEIRLGNGIAPNSPAAPHVSIIVPVYGQLAYTLNCLNALAKHDSHHSFEVIVVDDKSPDNSADVLARVPWIKLVRNPENLGFLRSCNAAAQHARGQYIVLLNNDTRVAPGWLDEMIDSFGHFPNAGLVGSKLFFSDGSLQEAGGVIWRDGSAWNFGRGDDPAKPEYCYARRVDYVSGAAIALPTAFWRQLGGFDERYAPAYCEDSDLAMRVRDAGKEVWMQPLSRVLHYEGKTSGTDTTQGVKAYQVRNTKILYERWKHVLDTHGVSGQNVPVETNRYASRRVLVLDAITPTPAEDAGSVTTTTTLKILQQLGYTPTFIPVENFLYYPPHTPALQRMGVQCGYVPFDMNFQEHIARHGADYDFVLAYRFSVLEKVLPDLKRLAPHLPIAFHNIDVHYLRMERQAALANDPSLLEKARQTKQAELNVIRAVDCTIVHSGVERDILQKEVPEADFVVFPYMTDLVGTKAGFEARKDVMFLGGYTHAPNEDAVLHFVKDIWPGLKASLPGAKFLAVGANPSKEMKALASEDVIVTGQVEDLAPYFDRSRLFLCPLRYGAGVKGKISTSMAHGLPVISTDIGVEGMELTPGRDVVVANGVPEFTDAVKALYGDKSRWEAMSAAGLKFVTEFNSFAMGMRKVREVIRLARQNHAS